MEHQPEVWPPAPAAMGAEQDAPEPPQTRNKPALFLGFLAGLLYDGVVGMAAPLTIEFIAGLGVGLLVLLLFLVLFRRFLRDFSRGLAASLVPFALVFLFVLYDFLTTPPMGHVVTL